MHPINSETIAVVTTILTMVATAVFNIAKIGSFKEKFDQQVVQIEEIKKREVTLSESVSKIETAQAVESTVLDSITSRLDRIEDKLDRLLDK